MRTSVSGVQLFVDHKSAASTSLDRSAVNLALMMMVTAVVLGLVSLTPATTVPSVSQARTARALRASVSRGLQASGVSTQPDPPNGRRRPLLAGLVSVSTVVDVKRRPTG